MVGLRDRRWPAAHDGFASRALRYLHQHGYEEQVVRKLATADRMLNEGKNVAGVCRELQVSEQTLPVAQPVRRDER